MSMLQETGDPLMDFSLFMEANLIGSFVYVSLAMAPLQYNTL